MYSVLLVGITLAASQAWLRCKWPAVACGGMGSEGIAVRDGWLIARGASIGGDTWLGSCRLMGYQRPRMPFPSLGQLYLSTLVQRATVGFCVVRTFHATG